MDCDEEEEEEEDDEDEGAYDLSPAEAHMLRHAAARYAAMQQRLSVLQEVFRQPSTTLTTPLQGFALEMPVGTVVANVNADAALPATVEEEATASDILQADSTKRKRKSKMNKHKWKKRMKEQRKQTRKDKA